MRFSWFVPSRFLEFVINGPQAPPQVEHRVVLSREQSVYAQSGRCCHVVKAPALEFVGDKHLALFFRKFVQSRIDFLDQYLASVGLLPGRRRARGAGLPTGTTLPSSSPVETCFFAASGFRLRNRSMMRFRATR